MLEIAKSCGYHWKDLPHKYTLTSSAGLTLYVHLRSLGDEIKTNSMQPGDLLLFWIRSREHPQHLAIYTGSTLIHASPLGARRVSERTLGDYRDKIFAVFRFRRPGVRPKHEVCLNPIVACEKCVLRDPRKYARPGTWSCTCGDR